MKIQYLKHNEIDKTKWDACISEASNSLVYAESWYLDIVSPNWEALVADDYDYVMPLPLKRKFGVPYLVQPPLTQQLGVFSSFEIDQKTISSFIRKNPYFSYHLHLNYKNSFKEASILPNYVLNLKPSYHETQKHYSKNTKRNLKNASNHNIHTTEIEYDHFLSFYHSVEKTFVAPKKNLVNNFIQEGSHKNVLKLYGAYNEKDEMLAALCLLLSAKRLIYLLPVSNEQGKEVSAMFKIIDDIILKNAESDATLDFEGSRIDGIARFYRGFGAELQTYYELKHWSVNDLIIKFRLLYRM